MRVLEWHTKICFQDKVKASSGMRLQWLQFGNAIIRKLNKVRILQSA